MYDLDMCVTLTLRTWLRVTTEQFSTVVILLPKRSSIFTRMGHSTYATGSFLLKSWTACKFLDFLEFFCCCQQENSRHTIIDKLALALVGT